MDERVLETQKWLNATYGERNGYNSVAEDGITGTGTFHGLIRAVQIELGISPTSDNFGPQTESKFKNLSKQSKGDEPTNLNYILQGAFWCKGQGYNPGGFTGNFFDQTESAVKSFQLDVGFLTQDGIVDGKLMKALLNTDGFKLDGGMGGREQVRTVQQILNINYGAYFDYIPTNGIYERKTNTALIYALQVEEGLGDIANGNFGDSTIRECPTLSPNNAPQEFTRILQMALACNGPAYDTKSFDGQYTSTVESSVSDFQNFMALPVTGIADMPTIKQLLTSNGYTGRSAKACDTSTIINNSTANTLVNNGYEVVGRYLTGNVLTSTGDLKSKAMTPEELSIIFDHDLRIFPIYQDGGYESIYFVRGKGTEDAYKAIRAAKQLGFPSGTTIYFAVDFDAYDYEVSGKIIPYMSEIRQIFNQAEPSYKIGVYGSRNTCIKCANDSSVKADYSFVGNMSTGYSGNLGFPMPQNWSFSQFFEETIGTKGGAIGIDKNDYSGLDTGASNVQPPDSGTTNPEYTALLEEWRKVGPNFPVLNSKPEFFTTNFTFDTTHEVLKSKIVDVDVITRTSFTIPGDDDTSTVVEVNNGELGASMSELLGDNYAQLSKSQINSYKDLTDDLSASIGNGWISMSKEALSNEFVISITAYKKKIPVEGGNTVELSITVRYTLKLNPFLPDFEEILGLAVATVVIGVAVLISMEVAAAGAIGVTVAVIVAFLTGEDDDDGEA